MSTQYINSIAALEPTPMVLGDIGDAVNALQAALTILGDYTGAIDGRYGAETVRAVSQFQGRYGLTGTGDYDADTWYALNFWVAEEEGWATSGAVTMPNVLTMVSDAIQGWLHPVRA